MKDQNLDKSDGVMDHLEKKLKIEKEHLELKLKELEKSIKIHNSIQYGEQFQRQISQAVKDGDYNFRNLGIIDVPVDKMCIAGPLKQLPKEAKFKVVKDLEIIRDIQDMRATGITEKEINKIGAEYKEIYIRYFKPHIKNIKGIEYDGYVLIEGGRQHAAYAKEMGFKELPVNTKRLEVSERIRLNHRFEREVAVASFYRNNPSRIEFMDRFEGALGNVDGFVQLKAKTLSDNISSARGYFSELVRAYRIQQAGLQVVALDKLVDTGKGKTDIDILVKRKDGTYIWIENKDVKEISKNEDFRAKIDKMASGLQNGVEINGHTLKISKAVFVNQGKISPEALDYARSKNIIIKEKMSASKEFSEYITKI